MIQIKVYDRTHDSLKENLKGSLLISDISFTANLNGGQGECVLQINKPITDESYDFGDIFEITKYSEFAKEYYDARLYTGYVSKIGRKQTNSKEYIEITLLGLASLLSEQYVTKTFTDKKAGEAIRELIDDYNASYGNVFYHDIFTIPDGPDLDPGESTATYLEVIQNICSITGYRFFIDRSGSVNFFEKKSEPNHFLTNKKDIEEIDIQGSLEGLVNSVYFISQSEAEDNSTYEDATSIAAYGKRYVTGLISLSGQTNVDNYAINYVNERKDPKKEATIVINRKYFIESLQPGDTIKVRNFAYTFENIEIQKVTYTQDRAILYLDRYVSLGGSIKALQA